MAGHGAQVAERLSQAARIKARSRRGRSSQVVARRRSRQVAARQWSGQVAARTEQEGRGAATERASRPCGRSNPIMEWSSQVAPAVVGVVAIELGCMAPGVLVEGFVSWGAELQSLYPTCSAIKASTPACSP